MYCIKSVSLLSIFNSLTKVEDCSSFVYYAVPICLYLKRLLYEATQSAIVTIMDIKKLFIATNQALTDVIKQITPEQFEMKVPAHMRYSDGQVLKTTINILAYENLCVPKVLHGEIGLAINKEFNEDLLKDDLVGNYERLSHVANEAVKSHADLEQIVHISYGDFPASGYLTDISIQRSTSAYDIGMLIGVDVSLPEDAVKGLWSIAVSYADYLREAGIFPPEIKVSDDASPEDKLLSLMGRQPKDAAVIVK